jgi:hypothetical protein
MHIQRDDLILRIQDTEHEFDNHPCGIEHMDLSQELVDMEIQMDIMNHQIRQIELEHQISKNEIIDDYSFKKPIGLEKQKLEYIELFNLVLKELQMKEAEIILFQTDNISNSNVANKEYFDLGYDVYFLTKELSKWRYLIENLEAMIVLIDYSK